MERVVLRSLTARCIFSSISQQGGTRRWVVVSLSNPSRQLLRPSPPSLRPSLHIIVRSLKGASCLWLNLKGKEPSVDSLLMLLSTVQFAGDARFSIHPTPSSDESLSVHPVSD